MRNSLLPRLLFSTFLALCAAAPLFLTGCGDDDSGTGYDSGVLHDLSATPDQSHPDLSTTNTDMNPDGI
jgi:hypothetical protein